MGYRSPLGGACLLRRMPMSVICPNPHKQSITEPYQQTKVMFGMHLCHHVHLITCLTHTVLASWVSLWTPKTLKMHPSGHPKNFVKNFLKCQSQAYNWFFHLHTIPMTLFKDIMPYFDKFIHVYGWNMSILWYPLKFWTPKNFTMGNFRHPVSKSWLRPCLHTWYWA